MARPYKQGLEYFPWDVRAFKDSKLSSLSYHYGPLGVMVYFRILILVYSEGYYLEMSEDDLAILLHQEIGPQWMRLDKILDMIHGCVERKLFEGVLFTQGVITSVSIQKQFILSTRKRKNINIDEYWLLDSKTMEQLGVLLSMQQNTVIDSNNQVNDVNNRVNVDINKQSKSKSKKDKKIKIDKSIYGYPKMHFLTKLIIERKYIKEFDSDVLKYNELFESAIYTYGYECVLSGVNYLISYSKNPNPPIDDLYNFMKVSLLNNLEHFKNLDNRRGESFEEWLKQGILQMGR